MASFVETMRGWLCDREGREHPAAFEVQARGARGRFALRGVISAPPFADEALAEGTLAISALPPSIAYRLRFASPAGEPLELAAEKHPTPLHPLRSMTAMEATVTDARGAQVAAGTMLFDLRDLPRFLASWLPVHALAQRQLEAARRRVERRLLAGA